MSLDPLIASSLRSALDAYASEGKLHAKEVLDRCYATFRARFGPDALRALDGPALLDAMHNTSNLSSLVYWLEFKNDDEMPAIFGSIAGGSALKFGLYRRKETGAWMTGHPSNQRELTIDEAVQMARRHRDQLIAGAAVLEPLAARPEAVDYEALQKAMLTAAPDVADLAWGHKYFSLLAPTVLDDYHVAHYQRFHLLKMLLAPPKDGGRYTAARGFLAAARELEVPVSTLTTALNLLHGVPYRCWRVGTGNDREPRGQWPSMQSKSRMGIGWTDVGDLSALERTRDARDALRKQVEARWQKGAQRAGIIASYLARVTHEVSIGDVVVAADGETNLAIGRVTGDYGFDGTEHFGHFRPVEWLEDLEWRFPEVEGLRTTLTEVRKDVNLLAIERRLANLGDRETPPGNGDSRPPPPGPLPPIVERIHAVLERKGQVILYGPPGTGKTHHAEVAARELAARAWLGRTFESLTPSERGSLLEGGAIDTCCFHPAYGYEDFLEGYRPRGANGAVAFELRDGVFKRLCQRAAASPTKPFYLIIDEINRGDIPRIFGELLLVLEKGRRGAPVTLPLSGARFVVPPNVFVIGTMNTADRSIALLDTALRRRFGFVELMPDASVLKNVVIHGIPLAPWLDALNERIVKHAGRDARNLQVGHSYLLQGQRPITELAQLAQALRDDIVPLLEEYCYEDYAALEHILGPTIVLRARQRIDDTLFAPAHADDLVRALLERCPDITTTSQAVRQDEPVEAGLPDEADEGLDQ